MAVKIEFFYSKSCPYCAPARKMVHEIAKMLDADVEMEEIDAWSEKGEPLAERYGIQVVPTIMINGVKCAEGILKREQLMAAVKKALGRQDL